MTLGYCRKFVHYRSIVFFRILFLFKEYVGLKHEESFSDRLLHSPLRQRPPRKRNQHKLTSGIRETASREMTVSDFDVLLTVHLSIILVTDQLNAQILVL